MTVGCHRRLVGPYSQIKLSHHSPGKSEELSGDLGRQRCSKDSGFFMTCELETSQTKHNWRQHFEPYKIIRDTVLLPYKLI